MQYRRCAAKCYSILSDLLPSIPDARVYNRRFRERHLLCAVQVSEMSVVAELLSSVALEQSKGSGLSRWETGVLEEALQLVPRTKQEVEQMIECQ